MSSVPVDRVPLELFATYFTLTEVGRLLQHAVEQQLRDDGGLTYVQFQVLAVLNGVPDRQMRITDIADRLVYSRSALTYQSKQLAKANLITRNPSPEVERTTILALTNQGERLLDRVLLGHVDVVRRTLLHPLSRSDTVTLGNLLGRVRDQLRTAPPRSAPPRSGG
jgi:DNA-binding MarR family transcriptional regulator